jgi:hypothetical protein
MPNGSCVAYSPAAGKKLESFGVTEAESWLTAFPLQPATEAVEALCDAWTQLAAEPRPDFNEKTWEDKLTKRLKIYVENVTARERGLLGMWAAEDVIGQVDPISKVLVEERRTDIVYGWNNDDTSTSMKLVFEFKRLGRTKRHRDHYLGDDGLQRFVTGIYSRQQAVAAMVGVLLDPEEEIVPPIRKMLDDEGLCQKLRLLQPANGTNITRPSELFGRADFDTEHERHPSLAASHGTIRVAHMFFHFGYPTTTRRPKK